MEAYRCRERFAGNDGRFCRGQSLPYCWPALLTLTVAHFRERPTEGSRVVFAVPRPSALLPLGAAPELSPDGTRLVFPGPSSDGRMLLWIRALDSLTAHAVAGTDNEGSPGAFWSPDGESIGFFADGKLKTIDVSGGPAHAIADAPDSYGASWSREGIIVFNTHEGPLFRVSASVGPRDARTRAGRIAQGNLPQLASLSPLWAPLPVLRCKRC